MEETNDKTLIRKNKYWPVIGFTSSIILLALDVMGILRLHAFSNTMPGRPNTPEFTTFSNLTESMLAYVSILILLSIIALVINIIGVIKSTKKSFNVWGIVITVICALVALCIGIMTIIISFGSAII
jgi:hypothetical protein